MDKVVEIRGQRFELEAQNENDDMVLHVRPHDARYAPLTAVIETAWRYDPSTFLDDARARRGRSFEGEVAYGFSAEDPDEVEEGVAAYWLGDSVTVDEEFFDALVDACATFWRDLPRV